MANTFATFTASPTAGRYVAANVGDMDELGDKVVAGVVKAFFPTKLHTWTGKKGEAQPIQTMEARHLRGILQKIESADLTETFSGIYNAITEELCGRGELEAR